MMSQPFCREPASVRRQRRTQAEAVISERARRIALLDAVERRERRLRAAGAQEHYEPMLTEAQAAMSRLSSDPLDAATGQGRR